VDQERFELGRVKAKESGYFQATPRHSQQNVAPPTDRASEQALSGSALTVAGAVGLHV
jgi:hypothetical protein